MEVTQLNVQQENEDWKRSEAKKDSYSFNENPREMCPATEAKKRQNKKKTPIHNLTFFGGNLYVTVIDI